MQSFGRSETHRYFQAQRQAVEWVRQFAQQHQLEIDLQGDGELQVAHRPSRQAELFAAQEFYTTVAQYPCALWSQAELAERAYRSPEAFGALHVGVGFGLNPLKYTLGLATQAHQQGAMLYAYSPVQRWDKEGRWHRLSTPQGTLRASRVIVATNGYTPDRLHPNLSDRLLPALSNIITTRPLTAAERAVQGWHTETPVYDTRHLLFYFRLLKDGRFLFGSRGGTVGSAAENDRRRQVMTQRLGEMFPAWRSVEITHFWNGLVCLSAALTPHVGQLPDDPSIFYGLAYHGNGVATGTWVGQMLARLGVDQEKPDDRCAVIRQPLKCFPLAALRLWYLRAAYASYSVQDNR